MTYSVLLGVPVYAIITVDNGIGNQDNVLMPIYAVRRPPARTRRTLAHARAAAPAVSPRPRLHRPARSTHRPRPSTAHTARWGTPTSISSGGGAARHHGMDTCDAMLCWQVLLLLWAALFRESVKRQEGGLRNHWGMEDFSLVDTHAARAAMRCGALLRGAGAVVALPAGA